MATGGQKHETLPSEAREGLYTGAASPCIGSCKDVGVLSCIVCRVLWRRLIGEGVQVMSTVFVFVPYCLIELNTATDRQTDRQLPYKSQEKEIGRCNRRSVGRSR